ncbi:CHAT domain-containing protein [Cyathus striatus]|nr:CHAT domain-containing protein [Cyathus striatus]
MPETESNPTRDDEISSEERLAKEHHQRGNDLFSQLMKNGNKSNDTEKLTEVAQAYEDALVHYSPTHPSRWKVMSNLAACCTITFRFTKDLGVLEEAISKQRQLLDMAESTSDRITALTNLGISFEERYQHVKLVDDINEAISIHTEALECSGYTGPHSKMCLDYLTKELITRFEITGGLDDLDAAIKHRRLALSELTDDADRISSLGWLGYYRYIRFECSANLDDLKESIDFLDEALILEEISSTGLSYQYVNSLAAGYIARFNHSGSVDDLTNSVNLFRRALSLSDPTNDLHASILSNLGTSLHSLYTTLKNKDDLYESITMIERALDYHPLGHPKHASTLSSLATSLIELFVDFGDLKSLDSAISLNEEALGTSMKEEDQLMVLNNLSHGLYVLHEHSGSRSDIDKAIELSREAVQISINLGKHVDNLAKTYDNLASSLSSRFQVLGNISDIQESIETHKKVLELRPHGNPNRFLSIARLATAIMLRYENVGAIEDLEEAIALKREAISAHPGLQSEKYGLFDSLALALNIRAEKLGTVQDHDEVIALHHLAVINCPQEHLLKASMFNNLATALFTRYSHAKDAQDLDDSIAYHIDALNLRPEGHPLRWKSLNNIGAALIVRFQNLGNTEDLLKSIDIFFESINFATPDHPEFPLVVLNLAAALYNRFELTRDITDLHSLTDLYFIAMQKLPKAHPDWSNIIYEIAHKYLIICRMSPRTDREYLEEAAFGLMEEATEHPTTPPIRRFTTALHWVQYAHKHEHRSHLLAYKHCLTALERCLVFAPSIEAQQALLSSVVPKSLASDAAFSAISEGRMDLAVEFLEQGRAILWARLNGYRHSLQEVRSVSPEAADRLENVTASIESFSFSLDAKQLDNHILNADQIGDNRILCDERERIIDAIRKLEGFSNFLRPVPYNSLQEAAKEGPVVYINASKHGVAALIVRAKEMPTCVPLPLASVESLEELQATFIKAKETHSQRLMANVLRTLWKDIAEPIVKRLLSLGIKFMSRIWWCPTSILCQFPLHAAGPYKKGGKNLSDMFISSYTPSLAALIRARSNLAQADEDENPKLLIMGQTATLPAVRDEVTRVTDLGSFVTPVVDDDASREEVLRLMRSHKWIHFACHGFQHPTQPFHSYFLLHNEEPLTLRDLVHAELPNAEFAFLSACHTATGDLEKTPDEMIHLAAAMQFIGFRSVVGTLWDMTDVDGPVITEAFYKSMLKDGWGGADFRNSAVALNEVTRKMRDLKISLNRCVNFVHIGA